jgi:hypothetical protein
LPYKNGSSGVNKRIKEKETPERYESSEVQILLAANKFQTGLDQPSIDKLPVRLKEGAHNEKAVLNARYECPCRIRFNVAVRSDSVDNLSDVWEVSPQIVVAPFFEERHEGLGLAAPFCRRKSAIVNGWIAPLRYNSHMTRPR